MTTHARRPLLEQAYDADLVAARKAQDAANKALDTANQRYVTAAKTKADLGQLKLSQLQYEAAAREFQAAADLVPASEPLIRAQYLAAGGMAASSAGIYPRAESALTEALRIREKLLASRPHRCSHQSEQPRDALPGARPLRRGRAFVQTRPRHQREGARLRSTRMSPPV